MIDDDDDDGDDDTPRVKPRQTGQYSIYLPRRDRRLSWSCKGVYMLQNGFVCAGRDVQIPLPVVLRQRSVDRRC